MKSRKSKPQFRERKLAFDSVLAVYRQAKDTGGMGAVIIGDGGKGTPNPVRPSLTDFRCDCQKIFSRCLTTEDACYRFSAAYIEYDSDDPIEMEIHADKVMGKGRHGLEQGMGALMIRNGVYPLYGSRGYFHTLRQPRRKI